MEYNITINVDSPEKMQDAITLLKSHGYNAEELKDNNILSITTEDFESVLGNMTNRDGKPKYSQKDIDQIIDLATSTTKFSIEDWDLAIEAFAKEYYDK